MALIEDQSVGREFAKLRGRVKKALDQNLRSDEPIRCVIRGTHGQAMIGTDTRVFVCKPGFMAGATLGAEVTSWNYANLVGVQVHKGMVSGSVLLQSHGQTGKKTGYWGQKKDDPTKAPNAIPVVDEWEQVQVGAALLRHLIDRAHAPRFSAPAASQSSTADELRKLANLHSEGILTAEEFRSAKSRLLGK